MCGCVYHRYDVFHYCQTHKEFFPHSQAACDAHRACEIKTFPISKFKHGEELVELKILPL